MTRATRIFARDPEAARAAVRRFSRALRDCEDDAEAWHALGAALAALGDRTRACAAFRNALAIDATRAHSQVALGKLLFDSGHWDLALRCFESASLPPEVATRSGP